MGSGGVLARSSKFSSMAIGFVLGAFFVYAFIQNEPPGLLRRLEQIQIALRSNKTEPPLPKNDESPREMTQQSLLSEMSFQKLEREKVKGLFNSVRVLCWVMSAPSLTDRRTAVTDTWGRRCQMLLFVTGDSNLKNVSQKNITSRILHITLPMTDHYSQLWRKTRLAFQFVHRHFRERFDWVLKIDDDSYVVMENLRLFLRTKSPEDPFYYGCPYKSNGGYNSGGPGYVLSAFNLDKLIQSFSGSSCAKEAATGPEDVEIAKCLRSVGIKKADTRDEKGRFRFSPFEPLHTIHSKLLPKQYGWFWGFTEFPLQKGLDCCADSFISFHYISPDQMRVMEFLIYYLHPFSGREVWQSD